MRSRLWYFLPCQIMAASEHTHRSHRAHYNHCGVKPRVAFFLATRPAGKNRRPEISPNGRAPSMRATVQTVDKDIPNI